MSQVYEFTSSSDYSLDKEIWLDMNKINIDYNDQEYKVDKGVQVGKPMIRSNKKNKCKKWIKPYIRRLVKPHANDFIYALIVEIIYGLFIKQPLERLLFGKR